jgi:hypothetical protein
LMAVAHYLEALDLQKSMTSTHLNDKLNAWSHTSTIKHYFCLNVSASKFQYLNWIRVNVFVFYWFHLRFSLAFMFI